MKITKPALRTFLFLLLFSITTLMQAQEEYRLIVFEGSDWCANCRRLNKKVLSKQETKSYLVQEGIAVQKVDFPQRKKLPQEVLDQNKALAEQYGFSGVFPTVLLVNTSTDAAQRIPYRNQNPQEFIALVQSAMQQSK